MAGTPSFARFRRSLLKAGAVTVGAVAATSVTHKEAAAQWWCWWCGDGGGTSGGSSGSGGSDGGVCFLRGTPVLTADGYRPIETLAVGEPVAAPPRW